MGCGMYTFAMANQVSAWIFVKEWRDGEVENLFSCMYVYSGSPVCIEWRNAVHKHIHGVASLLLVHVQTETRMLDPSHPTSHSWYMITSPSTAPCQLDQQPIARWWRGISVGLLDAGVVDYAGCVVQVEDC